MEAEISLNWTIQRENLIKLINTEYYETQYHSGNLPGITYALRISPIVQLELENETYVELSTTIITKNNMNANLDFEIKSANYKCSLKNQLLDQEKKTIKTYVCTTEELFNGYQEFFINNVLTIHFKAIFTYFQDYNIKFYPNFGQLLWENNQKDFVIFVENRQLLVHKLLLQTQSEVFATMLNPPWQEANKAEVTIQDFSYSTVEAAVRFCYGQDKNFNLEELIQMFIFADKYAMQHFMTSTLYKLYNSVTPETVIRILNETASFNAKEVQDFCFTALCYYQKKAIYVPNFEELETNLKINFYNQLFCQIAKN